MYYGHHDARLAEVLYSTAFCSVVDPSEADIATLREVFRGCSEDELRANLARVLSPLNPSEHTLDDLSWSAYHLCAGLEAANPVHCFRSIKFHLTSLFEGKIDEEIQKFFANSGHLGKDWTTSEGIAAASRVTITHEEMGRLLSHRTESP